MFYVQTSASLIQNKNYLPTMSFYTVLLSFFFMGKYPVSNLICFIFS